MATKMTREEAINKVRQMNLPKETMEILQALAPELAESEDERIRRWLCDYFSLIDKAWIHKDITCIDILRWLEKQKEQKPAEWSEEDKEILKLLILNIGRYMYFGGMSSERILSWLKSLRPQYHVDVTMTEAYKMGKEAGEASHWKPSEEQMNALKVTLDYMPDTFKPRCTLMTLQDDLKKQM